MSHRRAVVVGLIVAKVLGTWGLGWDIRWHVLIGRDSFWIPPHVLTYLSVALIAALSLGLLVAESVAAARGRRPADAVTLAGLTAPPAVHLAWWGIAVTILAAPIDDLWHRLFGIDVTLWSPPHLLGIAGAQINTLACLLIAARAWPPGLARTTAIALTGGLLFSGFQVVLSPAGLTAYRYGGVLFFTHALLGGLLLTAPLVLIARVAGARSTPVVVALVAAVLHVSVLAVSNIGFALVRPTPAVEEALAADPTSPIAVAHEIARRNGTTPGPSLRGYLLPLGPAVVMALLDVRRRLLTPALGFGASLWLASGALLSRAPAFSHALPSATEAAVALLLTLATSAAGAWAGRWLAEVFEAAGTRTRSAAPRSGAGEVTLPAANP